MAKISDIVSITITRETKTVTQAGFGVPLILGPNGTFTARTVREYADIEEVAEDFDTTDDEYKAANAVFAQSPRPEKVKISVRETCVAQVQELEFSAEFVTGNNIDLDIDDVAITTVSFTTDHDTTMAALATEIQSHASVSTATVKGGAGSKIIEITAATAGIPFVVDNIVVTGGASQPTGTMTTTTENVGVTEDLNAIVLNDDDWYALLLTSRTAAEVKLAAAWVEAKYKIFGTCTDDTDTKDSTKTTDIGYILQAANRERTFVVYNETPADWPDAAWFGKCLPKNPGSITWKFKTVSGPTASSLTATERSAVLAKNVNLFTEIGGVDMMEEGTMAEGEFIDIMRGIDWLRARMAENIFTELANADKIPYTNAGIGIIEAQIRASLENAIKVGLLAPDPDKFDGEPYEVSVPKVSEVSANDKGNRLLPDCTWQATLAGAVHKVTIQGRVEL